MLMKELCTRIKCKDGESLSVQASEFHYSCPRENTGPYTEVEVGFPSVSPPDSWAKYFDDNWEDESRRTESVYGYVPIELVEQFITDHGGSDVGDLQEYLK
jgi:hypothetical protein